MGKIIACLDGSAYADSVTSLSAWAAKCTGDPVALLHVVAPHSEAAAKGDLSGQIGLGAKSGLLNELVKIDEERGKLEQKKGQLILAHAKTMLARTGLDQPETLHRRGTLLQTLAEMEADAGLIILGKHGEHTTPTPGHLGANLENIIRTLHKPLLIAVRETRPVRRFLIAYDGGASSRKAVEFAANNPLLRGLECHLIKVGEANADTVASLKEAEATLTVAGFAVQASLVDGKSVDAIVAAYNTEHDMDLLLMGAFSHSKLHNLFLGSTTTAQIRRSTIPVLLFR